MSEPREFCIIRSKYFFNEHWSIEITEMSESIQKAIDATMRLKLKDPKYKPEKLYLIDRTAYETLKAERDRYKEALEKCEKNAGDVNMVGAIVDDALNQPEWVPSQARAALNGGDCE